jgi:hypothetical protein
MKRNDVMRRMWFGTAIGRMADRQSGGAAGTASAKTIGS